MTVMNGKICGYGLFESNVLEFMEDSKTREKYHLGKPNLG
jgi:hypothetical protein